MFKPSVIDNKLAAQNNFNNAILAKWEAFIDVKPASKRIYTTAVKQFINYLACNGIRQPEREDIINWRDGMRENKKATTIQTYLTAVKIFFRWLEQESLYKNIADHVKAVKVQTGHKKDFLTSNQSRAVLRNIKTDNIKGLRDYAMISLMLTTGIRTIEVIRADVNDIKEVGGESVLFVQGKGRDEKAEYVKIAPQVKKAIITYLEARGAVDGTAPLFTSTSNNNAGERITTRSVRKISKNVMIQAGYNSDRLTAHSMRHTAGTLALLNGATPREVQQLLRHSNINTTMIYAHELDRARNNAELRVANAIF
ncbi:MAG: tyrosine-type recombinase/integrase [Synergistaceae bacterium]|nr:tyrosine-type recombinase/integrase [Synergistaceae bacterium]